MQIRCPTCNRLTTWKENDFRPFCSQRCKEIDLGKWALEQYKVTEPAASNSDHNKSGENYNEDEDNSNITDYRDKQWNG